MVHTIKKTIVWSLFGGLFGVFFAVCASFLHMGPALTDGILETWWWFAALGAFAGYFKPDANLDLID